MKKFITLFYVSVLFASCSQTELEPLISKEYKQEQIAAAIQFNDSLYSKENATIAKQRVAVALLAKDLRLEGTKYILKVSESEAIERGIEPEIFKNLIDQLEIENKKIAEAIKSGENIKLSDPQIQMRRYNDEQARVRSRSFLSRQNAQYKFSGRITTNGQEQGTASFTTSNNTTYVLFDCGTTGGALVVSYICSVTAGGIKHTETTWTTNFCAPSLSVPVDMCGSGIIAQLTFQTTCPAGGYCIWRAN